VNYTTQYTLSVTATPNGDVTPTALALAGTTWEDAGTLVNLTATPHFHWKFAGWNASGPGSVAGAGATIGVHVNGPVWESAAFVYRVFPPPAVYWLTVKETGLPAGVSWNVSASGANASAGAAAATVTLMGLNGTYKLQIPAVYVGVGTRYVANDSSPVMVKVVANGSTSVTFSEQFALTVMASVGGTASTTGTSWVTAGSSQSLTATPATGYSFVGWTGSGTGAAQPYNGAAATSSVTVSGPTNETATFAPIVHPQSTGSKTAGEAPAFGLLAVLLVVGLVVGLIAGRRRGGRPEEPEPEVASESPPEGASSGDTYGDVPPGPAEGDETTYGEGPA